ncbi:hydroxymethylglutaryl-CoA lyase [Variovorax sp. PBL-E5]|uniref:hydroxymethylglutaryl-CoA lyase n=1 Tax=Variovorax sp. PBL-E5 TaxID=434014 RepID=UPI00131934AA|nr:hydroxymethylglutaryl-CoA lyase [Variovorax sp. PBL-E5]VTU46053.1 Hydroxymethylglutaryl-CoA lyase YngG [Variovorax sp. PBL-E5]
MSESKRKVHVHEVFMRDGLQNEAVFVPTDEKARMVDALSRTGLTKIEVTSFTSASAIPALRDADALMQRIERRPGVVYAALVLNLRGAQRALDARADELNLVVSASETHNLANTRMTRRQSRHALREVCRLAGEHAKVALSIGTAFGCPMEGAVLFDDVLDIADEFVGSGVAGITLCDTTGMADPAQVRKACAGLAGRWPGVALTLHLHDTRGMGLANALAGLEAGITRFDASLGGLGGCPFAPGASGNICTEDLVHMLEAVGCDTGVDLQALIDCAAELPGIVGHEIRGQVWRAGSADRRYPRPADFEQIVERAHVRESMQAAVGS